MSLSGRQVKILQVVDISALVRHMSVSTKQREQVHLLQGWRTLSCKSLSSPDGTIATDLRFRDLLSSIFDYYGESA